ncbi:MAG: ring-cleaving dioxygenase [Acidobacteriota bacterium]
MAHRLLGLHHVTATVDRAQPDLDFAAGALGLRLVKKTVNFDNHHVYHFYYGDARGTPGTIWTTFPYHGRGVRTGTKGAGQVTVTAFSVPAGSLPFWQDRLSAHGHGVTLSTGPFGEPTAAATDPSGLHIALVESRDDLRAGWQAAGVSRSHAVRGLHSVTLLVRSAAPTIDFLTGVLGFSTVAAAGDQSRLVVAAGGPGAQLDVVEAPDAAPAVNGLGTVHHVALAIATAGEQRQLREDLTARGFSVTPVLDRLYFQSIYFREPGGVLLEVATIAPGFAIDEAPDALGLALRLPPWQEPSRAEIEAGLDPIRPPLARP